MEIGPAVPFHPAVPIPPSQPLPAQGAQGRKIGGEIPFPEQADVLTAHHFHQHRDEPLVPGVKNPVQRLGGLGPVVPDQIVHPPSGFLVGKGSAYGGVREAGQLQCQPDPKDQMRPTGNLFFSAPFPCHWPAPRKGEGEFPKHKAPEFRWRAGTRLSRPPPGAVATRLRFGAGSGDVAVKDLHVQQDGAACAQCFTQGRHHGLGITDGMGRHPHGLG